MLSLSIRHQWFVGLALVGFMAATRSHHFATMTHLPDASWAVFFLAGVYLRPWVFFPILLGMAAAIDYLSIEYAGVSSFCVSPAYALLAPAYAVLWLAGRWYSKWHQFHWHSVLPLAASLVVGTVLCELLTSGGFYFLSGRFTETNLSEFGTRLIRYFPPSLQASAFYVGIATLIHTTFTLAIGRAQEDSAANP